MWWSAFSWDHRSQPYIWEPETVVKKQAAKVDLEAQNAARIEENEIN
jgi:hypothetical protein